MVSYNARGAGRYVSRSLRAGKDAAAGRGARRLIITAPTAYSTIPVGPNGAAWSMAKIAAPITNTTRPAKPAASNAL